MILKLLLGMFFMGVIVAGLGCVWLYIYRVVRDFWKLLGKINGEKDESKIQNFRNPNSKR